MSFITYYGNIKNKNIPVPLSKFVESVLEQSSSYTSVFLNIYEELFPKTWFLNLVLTVETHFVECRLKSFGKELFICILCPIIYYQLAQGLVTSLATAAPPGNGSWLPWSGHHNLQTCTDGMISTPFREYMVFPKLTSFCCCYLLTEGNCAVERECHRWRH